jgi:hypothetical protein
MNVYAVEDDQADAPFDEVARQLSDGVTDPAAITDAVVTAKLQRFTKTTLLRFAVAAVSEEARSRVRARVRAAEREASEVHRQRAEKAEAEARAADPFHGYKHGSVDKRRGAALRGCECEWCERALDIEARSVGRAFDAIGQIVSDYVAEMRMEWSDELLALSFAVDNTGATVTWGDATVEQHQSRIDMVTANAKANIEDAARHRAAIDEISVSDATCLNDLMAPLAQITS